MALRIVVQIPALDRLVAFLESAQQSQIDSLVAQVTALTQQLATHTTGLATAIQKDQ